jgi:protein-S-isoprenylcysteine O-methyltransferase Ste14
MSEGTRRGPLPPAIFLAGLIMQAVMHFSVPLTQLVPGWWRLGGVLPIVAGFAVAGVAEGRFKGVNTAVNPFASPSTLLTTGPFAYSRNPMYVGMLSIHLGAAVALGSLTPFLVLPVFAWILEVRFIRMEEAKLEHVFGDEYLEYRGQVRRWL